MPRGARTRPGRAPAGPVPAGVPGCRAWRRPTAARPRPDCRARSSRGPVARAWAGVWPGPTSRLRNRH
ncbi:MAG: hypothetical protein CVU30_14940 [Betaproteobacteria bacterium HGW-Betaproteobacteria-3]|nr:MAG: hypothetical protein CVU30_14940 [Betaproteobacteria bacterium HGW-Betaproteobacteria-3]